MNQAERQKLLRELGFIAVDRLRKPEEDQTQMKERQAEILSILSLSLEDAMEELQRVLVNTVSQ